ncbi:MAG: lytic transglycosylase domain-containing protein [Actinomycetota bacterium]
MKRVAQAGILLGLMVVLLPILALIGIGPPPADASEPSELALADIPANLLPIYRAAASESCDMPWEVLAAVGKIESDHGRSTLAGVTSGTNSAGAAGPMQFMPGTWAAYGVDGDGDGDTDIYDPVDAIWSGANYLCANGAGDRDDQGQPDADRLYNAIWHYNHSDEYVNDVIAQAAAYRQAGSIAPGGHATQLLAHPGLTIYPGGRADLQAGRIDQRVIDFLLWVLERHTISVSSLNSGHTEYVAGSDRRSHHFFGRAVDISVVDSQVVRATSTASRTLAEEINGLEQGRPVEVGTPWPDMENLPGFFHDNNHLDHLHIGYDGPR